MTISEICSGCSIFVLWLSVIAGIISLIVLDIIALKNISASDVHDECNNSALWYYVLVSLILTCIGSLFSQNNKDDKDNKDINNNKINNNNVVIINNFILSVAIFVWGSIELWGTECVDNINHTLLYKMAMVHWIIGVIVIGCCVLVCLFSCCAICCAT